MNRCTRLHPLRAVTLAAALAALAACTVGPDYVRPPARVPAAYKEAGASHDGAASTPADGWWTIYQDPTLDRLEAQMPAANQSLAAAQARLDQAQALVQVAASASVPTVGLGSLKSGKKNENDFGIGVSWEIDLWGRVRRDVEAHRASAEASAADLAGATLSLQAQLAQAYFALRQDDALIATMRRAAKADAQWQRVTQNQSAQGVASSQDVARAVLRATATELQLADTTAERAKLEHAVAVMLGRPPEEFAIAPAPFDARVPTIPAGLPAALLARRPDVRASERRMAAASARIGVSKAEQLPSISLAAGIGVRRGPTATADVRAPLFTGGKLPAQVTHANAGYREAVANYRQAVLDALREVEDALVVADTLAGNAALQSKVAAAAADAERVTRNQYREGVVDDAGVADATAAALDAQRSDLALRQRRLTASVELIKALGGRWGEGAAASAPIKR